MDILFWSGGKDALLALHFYRKQHPGKSPRLLTTYETESKVVPHQNIALEHIRRQAEALDLQLTTVPLPEDCPNEKYLDEVAQALKKLESPPEQLIFGDWYLEDIRRWRENMFGDLGYRCLFPIWKKELQELLPLLWFLPVEIKISAVMEQYRSLIKVGETFNQSFVIQLQYLPEEIDPMGEKGEFHTKVSFHTPKAPSPQGLYPQPTKSLFPG